MAIAHFDRELFDFLRELKANNNRDWFQFNKHRYESKVKQPMLRFIADFAAHLRKIHPRFLADPKPTGGSMFRIYRDVRFSPDKSPYKTVASAHFKHRKAGKHVHAPGFYLHLEPGSCFAASGVWHPDSRTLTTIRKSIVNREAEWKELRKNIRLEGDRLSRPPKGFRTDHPLIEDLKFKDFVTSESFPEEQVCSPSFISDFAAVCKRMLPLNVFLSNALRLP
jgi:uncharacterized protein (TIGR02453 family)